MFKSIKTKTFILIAAIIVIFDQITKFLITLVLSENESLLPANPFMNIILTYNTGAGFGILKDWILILGIISFVVAVGIIGFYKYIKDGDRLFVALILGGTIGNLIDRIVLHHVIDFLSFSFFPPVFNVADSAITLGVIGLIFNLLKNDLKITVVKKKKRKGHKMTKS